MTTLSRRSFLRGALRAAVVVSLPAGPAMALAERPKRTHVETARNIVFNDRPFGVWNEVRIYESETLGGRYFMANLRGEGLPPKVRWSEVGTIESFRGETFYPVPIAPDSPLGKLISDRGPK